MIFLFFFNKDIDRDLYEFTVNEHRKKELMYKNWYLNVYEPIQKQVNKNMTENGQYARNMRNEKYLEYLNQVNKHGAAYQDDFEPEYYNPIDIVQLDAHLPKRLRDPTNLPIRKTHIEDHIVIKCANDRNFSQKQTQQTRLPVILHDNETRADLDWNTWILKQYDQIESKVRAKSGLDFKPDFFEKKSK